MKRTRFLAFAVGTGVLAAVACSRKEEAPSATAQGLASALVCDTPAEATAALPSALPMVQPVSTGAVPGAFSVTSDGSASYTIPLEPLPGRNGLQPSLAVTYDSSAGEGTLGVGFSLQAVGAIERCGSNYAEDDRHAGVVFEGTDHLC